MNCEIFLTQNLTSSIFFCMSCSWSSHSCISESKLSISSGLSFPQPRPLCSSPRSRSMAAMMQAARYPGAFLNSNFPFSPVSLSCHGSPSGWWWLRDGRDWWPGNTIKANTREKRRLTKFCFCHSAPNLVLSQHFDTCHLSLSLKWLVMLDTFCPHKGIHGLLLSHSSPKNSQACKPTYTARVDKSVAWQPCMSLDSWSLWPPACLSVPCDMARET